VFTIFQGGKITPWGKDEQSIYIDDPFAGPWNHWPLHFVPSDGRFAVDVDRVTHFALGANDHTPEFGSLVFYGFTNQGIETLIPTAKAWRNPPVIPKCEGAENVGFDKDQKAFVFQLISDRLSFQIEAAKQSPIVNPAFVIEKWNSYLDAEIKINGKIIRNGNDCRQGMTRDTDGSIKKIIWLKLTSEISLTVEVIKKHQ
jgi:hypothetical protein